MNIVKVVSDANTIIDVPASTPRRALLKAHAATDCADFKEYDYEDKYGSSIVLEPSTKPGVVLLKLGRWSTEEKIKYQA